MVLMLVHGLGEHSGRYADFAGHLTQAGISVFSFDLRGHGRSQGLRGHVDAFPRFLEDLLAMEGEMATRAGSHLPAALLGHSLGGLIALRRLQSFAGPFKGAVLSAPWLRAAKPDWIRSLGRALGWALPEFPFPSGTDPGRLTRDPEIIRSIREDPLIHRRITGRLYREAERVQAEVLECPGTLRLPLLFLVPGKDRVVQSSVTEAFAQQLTGKGVQIEALPDRLHEPHNDLGREEVYALTSSWLLSLCETGPSEAEIP
jgi:alpha-beta hydrolase superfamily lysophospholipase